MASKNEVVRETGLALRAIREAAGLLQDEVARRARITRPMLSGYERGKVQPNLETLDRILAALDSDYTTFQQYRLHVGPHHPARAAESKVPVHRPPTKRKAQAAEVVPGAEEALNAMAGAFRTWLQCLEQEFRSEMAERTSEVDEVPE